MTAGRKNASARPPRFDRPFRDCPDTRQQGAVLVTLIVSMTVFAVLGVAMYSLFSTSLFGVSSVNDAKRSYYLAESGMRYAVSEARNSADPKSALLSLNGTTMQVAAVGSFALSVNPYFGSTTGNALTQVGTNQVTILFGGAGFPDDFTIPANAKLQVGANAAQAIMAPAFIAKGSVSVAFLFGANIQIDNGTTVLTVFLFPTDSSSQTIGQGDDLVLNIPETGGLPVKNGTFVDGATGTAYQYRSAAVQGGKVVLDTVTWTGGATTTFSANTDLTFSHAAVVVSSATVNTAQKLHTDTLSL